MRIFQSAVEAVKEVERDLWEMGHKVKNKSVQDQVGEVESREIVGYSFTLLDGQDWPETFETLGLKDGRDCRRYVEAEFSERIQPLNPPNPGLAWMERPDVWNKFLHGGRFSYTYSERMHELRAPFTGDQLVLNQMKSTNFLRSDKDPSSRQLVIQIYDAHLDSMNRGGIARVPCTMYYQILYRNGICYLIHNMRSCDLYTHFPIDLSISWLLSKYVAGKDEISRVIMQFGSLHAFEKDLKPRGIF
jgi:hypothetical protein